MRQAVIIGGGIGGLAAGLALSQRGFGVRVFEQAPQLGAFGAGIQISPNGMAVIRALGLQDHITSLAPRARAVVLRDFRHGAEVAQMPLSSPRRPYHFVHRADLLDGLHKALIAAGGEIVTGAKVAEYGAGMAHFTEGGQVEADLILAADGLHSPARAALNPRSRPFFTGQVAWRALIETPDALTDAPCDVQLFMGPARHLVVYPLRGGRLLNIVAVEERDLWAAEGWSHRDDPKSLRRAFGDFCPEVRALLARVETCHLWGLFRHPVAKVWQDGRLALLGDAAHPTLPFLAQGANMALEDAFVLARCLTETNDQAAALARYEALRRPRTARIVQAASDQAEAYHMRPSLLRWGAHRALGMVARRAPHLLAARFEWLYGHDVTA